MGKIIDTPDLRRFLERIVVGDKPLAIEGQLFVPLFLDDDGPEVDLLEESAARGETIVREVSDEGTVERIVVKHSGERLLLLVDGEQITGARQNRIFNASYLVAPGEEVELPVSCVEQGRWSYTSAAFAAAGTTMTATARSRKVRRISSQLISDGSYDANQSAVWADVSAYLTQVDVTSASSSLDEGMQTQLVATDAGVEQLSPSRGQIGIALVRGDALVSIDLFASSSTYQRAYSTVVRGLLADAPQKKEPRQECDASLVVRKAVSHWCELRAERRAAPGCGTTLVGQSDDLAFVAIAHGDQLYHAVATAC
jgi:hypothetical protein